MSKDPVLPGMFDTVIERAAPVVRHSDPASSHEAAKAIEPKRETLNAKVLALLRQHQGQWIPGYQFTDQSVGGSEGLRRLRELRKTGWAIERKRAEGKRTTWFYRLP